MIYFRGMRLTYNDMAENPLLDGREVDSNYNRELFGADIDAYVDDDFAWVEDYDKNNTFYYTDKDLEEFLADRYSNKYYAHGSLIHGRTTEYEYHLELSDLVDIAKIGNSIRPRIQLEVDYPGARDYVEYLELCNQAFDEYKGR